MANIDITKLPIYGYLNDIYSVFVDPEIPIFALKSDTGTGKSLVEPYDLANRPNLQPLFKKINQYLTTSNLSDVNRQQINDILTNLKSTTDLAYIKSIADYFKVELRNNRVFVVESKSTSVRALYQAQEKISQPHLIGYATNAEDQYSLKYKNLKSTDGFLAYVTATHLLKRVLHNYSGGQSSRVEIESSTNSQPGQPFSFIDVLIFDDQEDLDSSILEYLRDYFVRLNLVKPTFYIPKTIIMAATLNVEYYDKIMPVIDLETESPYPIMNYYNEVTYPPIGNKLYDDMVEKITLMYNSSARGDYLVFCPGYDMIEYVTGKLKAKNLEHVNLIQAYSKVSREALAAINAPRVYTPDGQPIYKIIISTNLLESAITIESIIGVFDPMVTRLLTTLANDSSALITTYESKEIAKQRRGRVGRTSEGFYYAMMREQDYLKLADRLESAISRVPVYNIIIQLLAAGIDVKQADFIPLEYTKKFNEAHMLIQQLGLLKFEHDRWVITEAGKFSSQFSINIRLSNFLYRWISQGQLPIYMAAVIAGIIDNSNQSLFRYLRRHEGEEKNDYYRRRELYYKTHYVDFAANNDLEIYLKIWIHLFSSGIKAFDDKEIKTVNKWAYDNAIDVKTLRHLIKKVKIILTTLKRLNYNITVTKIDLSDIPNIVDYATDFLQMTYFNHILVLTRDHPNYLIYQSVWSRGELYFVQSQPMSNIVALKPNNLISFADFSRVTNGRTRHDVTFSIPAKLSGLQVLEQLKAETMGDIFEGFNVVATDNKVVNDEDIDLKALEDELGITNDATTQASLKFNTMFTYSSASGLPSSVKSIELVPETKVNVVDIRQRQEEKNRSLATRIVDIGAPDLLNTHISSLAATNPTVNLANFSIVTPTTLIDTSTLLGELDVPM